MYIEYVIWNNLRSIMSDWPMLLNMSVNQMLSWYSVMFVITSNVNKADWDNTKKLMNAKYFNSILYWVIIPYFLNFLLQSTWPVVEVFFFDFCGFFYLVLVNLLWSVQPTRLTWYFVIKNTYNIKNKKNIYKYKSTIKPYISAIIKINHTDLSKYM